LPHRIVTGEKRFITLTIVACTIKNFDDCK